MESSYNKLKWKNGRDIGEDNIAIAGKSRVRTNYGHAK